MQDATSHLSQTSLTEEKVYKSIQDTAVSEPHQSSEDKAQIAPEKKVVILADQQGRKVRRIL